MVEGPTNLKGVYVDILDLDLESWSSGAISLMEIMSHLWDRLWRIKLSNKIMDLKCKIMRIFDKVNWDHSAFKEDC